MQMETIVKKRNKKSVPNWNALLILTANKLYSNFNLKTQIPIIFSYSTTIL